MDNMAASDVDIMETSMMSHTSNVSAPGGTLSMREKSQLKRRINKEHNTNFRAGYVPVNEEYLHKAGIRGRKRFLLYTCVVVLLVLAVLNTALTVWLMWIYHISHTGMRPLEFTHSSAGALLRFLDEARFDSLMLNRAFLGSRSERNLTFTGVHSKSKFNYTLKSDARAFQTLASEKRSSQPNYELKLFKLSASDAENASSVEVTTDMIRFSIDDLKLMTLSGRQYFSLADMKIAGLKNVKNLHVEELQTRQVKNAPNYDDLMIESWNQTNITGCLGVQATSGRETDITAQNVYISSLNGSTVLDGLVGMYISTSIPQVNDNLPINHNIINSKICVCRQSGRVFVVPVSKPGMGCATANELVNPCQM